MINVIERIKEFFEEAFSIIVALIRLIFLTFAMLTSGIQIILFTRTEIWNMEMKGMPWRCDREKMADQMSFVDKICLENPDLLDFADEQMRNNGDLPPDVQDGGEE